jgi:hypothetical protein
VLARDRRGGSGFNIVRLREGDHVGKVGEVSGARKRTPVSYIIKIFRRSTRDFVNSAPSDRRLTLS